MEECGRSSRNIKAGGLIWPGLKVGEKGHGLYHQLHPISHFPVLSWAILSSFLKIIPDYWNWF